MVEEGCEQFNLLQIQISLKSIHEYNILIFKLNHLIIKNVQQNVMQFDWNSVL